MASWFRPGEGGLKRLLAKADDQTNPGCTSSSSVVSKGVSKKYCSNILRCPSCDCGWSRVCAHPARIASSMQCMPAAVWAPNHEVWTQRTQALRTKRTQICALRYSTQTASESISRNRPETAKTGEAPAKGSETAVLLGEVHKTLKPLCISLISEAGTLYIINRSTRKTKRTTTLNLPCRMWHSPFAGPNLPMYSCSPAPLVPFTRLQGNKAIKASRESESPKQIPSRAVLVTEQMLGAELPLPKWDCLIRQPPNAMDCLRAG